MTDQHPTPEQIERYIEWADAEAGPFCTDEWMEAVRQHLRQWVAPAKRRRVTPEQWEDAGAFASDTRACLLELRARVEALEAAAISAPENPDTSFDRPSPTAAPADSLVERVAKALIITPHQARAAIREVAAWLNERDLQIQNEPDCLEAPFADDAVRWLREEASR